jgi:MFS family permease
VKYETRLVLVLATTFGIVFFDRNAANFLMPMIAGDLRLTNRQVGLIVSALSLTWAVAGFLGGTLTDRTGRRKPFLVAVIVCFSLCSMLSGLATSFMSLLLARLLMGLAEGPVLPISLSTMVFESSPSRRGLNMGLVTNCGSNLLGGFLAPLILVPIATVFTWRTAFFLAGMPGLVMALIIAKYMREPPVHEVHPQTSGHADERMGMLEMIKYRNIWLCMAICVAMVAWLMVGGGFLPLLFVKMRHLSAGRMSMLMSVLGLSAAASSFLVPGLSDRIGRRPVVIAFCVLAIAVPLSALCFQGSFFMLTVLMFVSWSAVGAFPLIMGTIPSETIPARYVATSMGMIMGLGEVLGGVLAPATAGWAADRYGLSAPMLVMVACATTGATLALFLKETAPARLQMAR